MPDLTQIEQSDDLALEVISQKQTTTEYTVKTSLDKFFESEKPPQEIIVELFNMNLYRKVKFLTQEFDMNIYVHRNY